METLAYRTEFWTILLSIKVVVITVLYLWNRKKSNHAKSEKIDESKLMNWKPYPMVEEDVEPEEPVIMGKISENVLNMSATNFLSLGKEKQTEIDTIAALRKYGVGSCGPRGFYGTIDVHLELEERLAKFMGVEEACVYSYGFSTIASAIPAYAKKGDLIFVDERVNFAIQKGLNASRSDIIFFKHNDMSHLEELVASKADRILKKRSFIVTEAIFYNTGRLCALPKLIEIRKKYKLRLILDESLSVGVIGKNGRGVSEHFDIPISEIDLIIGSLENSFGSIGGFCVGSHFIVEHQRLSGLGYCFSASLPPLLSQAAITSLNFIEAEPHRMKKLCENSRKLQSALETLSCFRVSSDPLSPIKHIYVKSEEIDLDQKQRYLKKITDYCMSNGIAISVAAYLKHAEVDCPEPSIRIASNSNITLQQIDKLIYLLKSGYESIKAL